MLNATSTFYGILALTIFFIAYGLVVTEEFTKLRKSKPVLLASGLIWLLVALVAKQSNQVASVELAVKENLLEYGELLLFLLVAMTYVNVMQERKIFDALRAWLVKHGFTLRELFWITGCIAFFLSPLVDNLTTALIMCAVVTAVGKQHSKFIALSCINIVVAANAGGVFSPFGDITTLMIWQYGAVEFTQFFKIVVPAAVSYLIPAIVMSLYIPNSPSNAINARVTMGSGSKMVMLLFAITIATAVCFKLFLDLPPVLGMMMGLGYLNIFGYYLKMQYFKVATPIGSPLDIMKTFERIEWETLLFFYGIMLCVGGLATLGYLDVVAHFLYQNSSLGLSAAQQATPANVTLGLISALLGNIPVVYAILTMDPQMSQGQWLLATLTSGIGGSILPIGSAAGVALMGQAPGKYTFFSHLRWAPLIIVGYFAGAAAHLIINSNLF